VTGQTISAVQGAGRKGKDAAKKLEKACVGSAWFS